MIDDVTLGVGSAITRINARTVHACVISGALAVRHALRHDIGRYAFNCSVADVADRTLANRKMIVNVAQRIPAARIAGKTRIYAERINALLVTRAFVVRVTFRPKSRQWRDWNSYTLYISIAREVLRTEANASVRCGFTLRVEAASGCQAGIHASSVQALLMISAILIQVTLHVAQDYRLALAISIGDRVRWT